MWLKVPTEWLLIKMDGYQNDEKISRVKRGTIKKVSKS